MTFQGIYGQISINDSILVTAFSTHCLTNLDPSRRPNTAAVADFNSLNCDNDDRVEQMTRTVIHGLLSDLVSAAKKQRLANGVYGLLLYQGIGVEKCEQSGFSWSRQAHREGLEIGTKKLCDIENETGIPFDLADPPVQNMHTSSLFLLILTARPMTWPN
jgi:hypothetical protein